jgi:hypothetical protein
MHGSGALLDFWTDASVFCSPVGGIVVVGQPTEPTDVSM